MPDSEIRLLDLNFEGLTEIMRLAVLVIAFLLRLVSRADLAEQILVS